MMATIEVHSQVLSNVDLAYNAFPVESVVVYCYDKHLPANVRYLGCAHSDLEGLIHVVLARKSVNTDDLAFHKFREVRDLNAVQRGILGLVMRSTPAKSYQQVAFIIAGKSDVTLNGLTMPKMEDLTPYSLEELLQRM